VHYRNAVDLAPDRPEAHFRLGLAFAALKQYASAIREFKRSLEMDPTLPQSGDRLSTIFGDNNKIPQATLLPTVADWAREDLNDGDRLFLLDCCCTTMTTRVAAKCLRRPSGSPDPRTISRRF